MTADDLMRKECRGQARVPSSHTRWVWVRVVWLWKKSSTSTWDAYDVRS